MVSSLSRIGLAALAVSLAGRGAAGEARAAAAISMPTQRLAARALRTSPEVAEHALGLRAAPRGVDAQPRCVVGWCPAKVEVPGMTTAGPQADGARLAYAVLDRAPVEAVSSIARALSVVGFSVDWRPPWIDRGAGTRGIGTLTMRMQLRLDASNRPVLSARGP